MKKKHKCKFYNLHHKTKKLLLFKFICYTMSTKETCILDKHTTYAELTNMKTKKIMKKIYSSTLAYMKQSRKLGWNIICNLEFAIYVPWFAFLSLIKKLFKPICCECCQIFTWQNNLYKHDIRNKQCQTAEFVQIESFELPNELISTRKFSIIECYAMSTPS